MLLENLYDAVKSRLSKKKVRVAFPEDLDQRVHGAWKKLVQQGIVDELLLFSSDADFKKAQNNSQNFLSSITDKKVCRIASHFPNIVDNTFHFSHFIPFSSSSSIRNLSILSKPQIFY